MHVNAFNIENDEWRNVMNTVPTCTKHKPRAQGDPMGDGGHSKEPLFVHCSLCIIVYCLLLFIVCLIVIVTVIVSYCSLLFVAYCVLVFLDFCGEETPCRESDYDHKEASVNE